MEELTDKFGRIIRLTDERMEHLINSHPELQSIKLIATIKDTLLNPDEIIVSSSDETVELFYRFYFRTSVGDKWFCVLVKSITDDPFIITAYFTDKIKNGEVIWKKT